MNVVFGAGGVARELAWLMREARPGDGDVRIPHAFVTADSDCDWTTERTLDDVPVLRESDFLSRRATDICHVYVGIGLPAVRRRVVANVRASMSCVFPCLIHPRATMDDRAGKVRIGEGAVIYPGVSLTTEIEIGDFVHINPCAAVAHGASVGSFSTLCPGAIVSGNVTIGAGCFIGAGAIIKEGVRIADNCTIGAGAVVIKTITEPGTWAGVPARQL